MKKSFYWPFLLLMLLIVLSQVCPAFAAGDYLNYQEPKATGTSWFSTMGYLFSLFVTFAAVIGLAYFTSRYLGQRMGHAKATGNNKVLVSLPLGPNRGVSVVQIAGKILVLGVTDHNINLLQEITDPEEVDNLKANAVMPTNQFDIIFQKHLNTLQQMSQKFPGVFGGFNRNENEREKR